VLPAWLAGVLDDAAGVRATAPDCYLLWRDDGWLWLAPYRLNTRIRCCISRRSDAILLTSDNDGTTPNAKNQQDASQLPIEDHETPPDEPVVEAMPTSSCQIVSDEIRRDLTLTCCVPSRQRSGIQFARRAVLFTRAEPNAKSARGVAQWTKNAG
jgi:hypothetical protein